MTDAREIIVEALFEFSGSGQGIDDMLKAVSEMQADAIVAGLDAAGIRLAGTEDRILGPDEVDQVTVERCIRIVAESAPDDTGKWCPYRSWALRSIPTLRALGRKA